MEAIEAGKKLIFSKVNYKRGIAYDMSENYNELLPCVAMCTNLNEIRILLILIHENKKDKSKQNLR